MHVESGTTLDRDIIDNRYAWIERNYVHLYLLSTMYYVYIYIYYLYLT